LNGLPQCGLGVNGMLPATQVVFRSVLCDSCAIERKASLIALWRGIMQHENWRCHFLPFEEDTKLLTRSFTRGIAIFMPVNSRLA